MIDTRPPRPWFVFRRHDDERWYHAGDVNASYEKPWGKRKAVFSHWKRYEITAQLKKSIWVKEWKEVTEEEAKNLCQA